MNKASISCLAKENGSSRIRLSSNSAIQDIIATNHVVLKKESHSSRLSRVCKGMAFIFLLALITIGIVTLTVVLARARNALVATLNRSSESNKIFKSNETRILTVVRENLTTMFDEEKKDNWQTSTVTLTTDHFDQFTTENIHLSSTIMRTKQSNEYRTTMKPYPSSDTIVNEQLTTLNTIQTTNDYQHNSELTSSEQIKTVMRKEIELTTASTTTRLPLTTNEFLTKTFTVLSTESERLSESSTSFSNNLTESSSATGTTGTTGTVATTTSTSNQDELTSAYIDPSTTNFFNQRFSWQSSTVESIDDTTEQQTTTETQRSFIKQTNDDDGDDIDIYNDLLFS